MEAVLADTSNQWRVLSEAAPYTRRFAHVTLAVWSSMCFAFGCQGVWYFVVGMRGHQGVWHLVVRVRGRQGV